ncbi:glycosyltransferase [Prosthecobacter sp. SYSU 5D2]|uniref:glycosyltransferase n=1 Tax=Prosthecobacter sp. SYSU 5D2 TaxID=3134134 RepID=UPI0031FF0DC0
MKIAMVSSSASRSAGGIFEVERRLSLELAGPLGHEVEVFSGEDVHSLADAPSWLPLRPKLYQCVGPKAFGYSPGMSEGLEAWNPDVVHLHMLWMYPSLVVNRSARTSGRPYMITLHGMLDAWALRNSSWKKQMALFLYERRNLQDAACIQVLSEAEARSAREFGLGNPLAVIPNGMDLPDEVQLRKAPGGRRRLLFLGRLHPKKGLMNLLRAWKAVMSSEVGKGWNLTIAGWSEVGHEEELMKLADELDIPFETVNRGNEGGARLVFSGPQFGAEKEACLRDCDAFVLPSLSEGLPMSVLEAWAYGKPVLMTRMCNLPEGFAAEAAIPVEPEAASLTEGLIKLMQMTEAERLAMGLRGRKLVESRFTWCRVGAQMAGVYRWMVEGGCPPSCVMMV